MFEANISSRNLVLLSFHQFLFLSSTHLLKWQPSLQVISENCQLLFSLFKIGVNKEESIEDCLRRLLKPHAAERIAPVLRKQGITTKKEFIQNGRKLQKTVSQHVGLNFS